MLQYGEFALALTLEIFSQYESWLGKDLCVYYSKLSFIVLLPLINYSSYILAFVDKTTLTLCRSTLCQITKAADSEEEGYGKHDDCYLGLTFNIPSSYSNTLLSHLLGL
jgi:hypothetical protein